MFTLFCLLALGVWPHELPWPRELIFSFLFLSLVADVMLWKKHNNR